jgi:hypothetical protein
MAEGERGPFDVVFATSMCSLADFRGSVRGSIARLPHVLYMHENQAAYPVSDGVSHETIDRDDHLAFTNLASIAAADRVLWNSAYNRLSFIDGMEGILTHAPERIDGSWRNALEAKSSVAWPPVEVLHNEQVDRYPAGPIRVAWPHRWEHDKGLEELSALIDASAGRDPAAIRWVILGCGNSAGSEAMRPILAKHQDRIEHFEGNADRETYRAALASCEWVSSTARHEFFGIAVVEALMLGCLPWLPARLSYPELVPEACRGFTPWSPPEDPAAVRAAVQEHLAPAHAPVAVARIDSELEGLMESEAR